MLARIAAQGMARRRWAPESRGHGRFFFFAYVLAQARPVTERTCASCGEWMLGMGRRAYCADACRQRAYRLRLRARMGDQAAV